MAFFSRSSKVAPSTTIATIATTTATGTSTSSKKISSTNSQTPDLKKKSILHLPFLEKNQKNSLPPVPSTGVGAGPGPGADEEDEILEENYNKYIKQIHSTDLVIFKSWYCIIDQHHSRPLENNTMKVSELIDRLVSYHLLSDDSFQTNEIELFLSQAKLQLDDVITFRQFIQTLFLTKIYEKKRKLNQSGGLSHFLSHKSTSLGPNSPQEKRKKDFFRSHTTATGTETTTVTAKGGGSVLTTVTHGAVGSNTTQTSTPPPQLQQQKSKSFFPSLRTKQKSGKFNFMKFTSFDRDEKVQLARQSSIEEDQDGSAGTSIATLSTNPTNHLPTTYQPRVLMAKSSFEEEKSFPRRLFKRLSSNIISSMESVDTLDQDERSGRAGGRSIAAYFRRRDNNVDGAVKKICKVTIHSIDG
jgi:hypothetical protein